ncbi:MAG TPA: oligopeptide transporter, OPT family [Vicinamibacteria bacterium]
MDRELTFKAVFLGVLMAVALGSANAYLGMKAGLTVSATFPAAVVAMAALRPFRGTILEENIARTAASVGEALVAGAIFTIPAFVLAGAWEELHYFESTLIMLIGGVLGVLFIIVLRRPLVVDSDLPFPESVAAAEIHKAGQGGQTGAKFVFGAMGLGALWELFKNTNGIHLIADSASRFVNFSRSTIRIAEEDISYRGGLYLGAPTLSPALMGVGFIVGARISAVVFAGAVLGWLVLVPLALFLNPSFSAAARSDLAGEVWFRQVRPLAVGTMIVAAFQTLYGLAGPLVAGIGKAIQGRNARADEDRTERDISLTKTAAGVAVAAVATFFLYDYFAGSIAGALVLTLVMVILGFLFSAVAGYLAGLIGGSNSPISGLTLSALLIAAVLMVAMGLTDIKGVAAVLGVAGVICCATGIAGDMMQDLKVGRILGGTPWRMEAAEILGVLGASLVLTLPLSALHQVYGIGSAALPAPQAGLMALMAGGIVGGEMAWPLVIAGMFLALALILIGAPSPMLIAVGMYLPFESTAAIFVGGLLRFVLDRLLDRRKASSDERLRAENVGTLLASGLIAGESLMAIVLAFLVLGADFVPAVAAMRESVSGIRPSYPLGLVIYPILGYLFVWRPLRK